MSATPKPTWNCCPKAAPIALWLVSSLAAIPGCDRGGSSTASGSSPISDSVACGNYLLSIACTAHLWSGDHGDRLPPDLVCLSNELNVPKILICPGDHTRPPAPKWTAFSPTNSSYELATPGLLMDASDTNTVILRCKFHGSVAYADGSVFDGTQRRRTKIPP